MLEWCTGTRLLVHWAAIAMFRMVALDLAFCVCVCWFMHEYRHACIVLMRMQFIDCSGADELKAGWDVKENDLQGDLTKSKFNIFN